MCGQFKYEGGGLKSDIQQLLINKKEDLKTASGRESRENQTDAEQLFLDTNSLSHLPEEGGQGRISQSLSPRRSGFSGPRTPDTDSTFAGRRRCRNDLKRQKERQTCCLKTRDYDFSMIFQDCISFSGTKSLSFFLFLFILFCLNPGS